MVTNVSLIERENFLFHFQISFIPCGLAGKFFTREIICPVDAFYKPLLRQMYARTALYIQTVSCDAEAK